MGPEFIQLSGEDATALAFIANGGHGCISVASNVAPRLYSELQNLCLAGDFKKALALQDKLMPLNEVMFVETNPVLRSTPFRALASARKRCACPWFR